VVPKAQKEVSSESLFLFFEFFFAPDQFGEVSIRSTYSLGDCKFYDGVKISQISKQFNAWFLHKHSLYAWEV